MNLWFLRRGDGPPLDGLGVVEIIEKLNELLIFKNACVEADAHDAVHDLPHTLGDLFDAFFESVLRFLIGFWGCGSVDFFPPSREENTPEAAFVSRARHRPPDRTAPRPKTSFP